MKPKIEHIKLAQRIIVTKDDGDFGKNSIAAARKYLRSWPYKGAPTATRYVAAIIQRAAAALPINAGVPDAYWGLQTEDAAYRMLGKEHVGWRPDEKQNVSPHDLSPVRCWTPTDREMTAKYGQVGSNQVLIKLPYAMRLAWDTSTVVTRTSCHVLVADSLIAALETTRDHYGLEGITELGLDLYGGCLNVRKKRGGSTWSAHAWGTAIDLDPDRNQLAWKRGRAEFAKAIYDPFHKAFADEGWMSLGTCYDFDWMHKQRNP